MIGLKHWLINSESLTNEQIAESLATRLLGLHLDYPDDQEAHTGPPTLWVDSEDNGWWTVDEWNPAVNYQSHIVLAEIEERELRVPYIICLGEIIGNDNKWRMVFATHRERCLAALLMLDMFCLKCHKDHEFCECSCDGSCQK